MSVNFDDEMCCNCFNKTKWQIPKWNLRFQIKYSCCMFALAVCTVIVINYCEAHAWISCDWNAISTVLLRFFLWQPSWSVVHCSTFSELSTIQHLGRLVPFSRAVLLLSQIPRSMERGRHLQGIRISWINHQSL